MHRRTPDGPAWLRTGSGAAPSLPRRTVRAVKRLPKTVRRRTRARYNSSQVFYLWNYGSDLRRFLTHSAVRTADSHTKLRARLIRQYHIIEKALALRDPARALGRFRIQPFLDDIERYLATYGVDETSTRALQALRELRDFPEVSTRQDTPTSRARLTTLLEDLTGNDETSTIRLRREDVHARAKLDLSGFFDSRHSVRQFDPAEVDVDLIRQAARMAQRTPSVCNRQAWRVHVLEDPVLREQALAQQGGSTGFGEEADKALIITCNVGNYLRIGERHQAGVDGGMFAMSLVYALHSLGLGTCCLNWGKDRREDLRAKEVLDLPDEETIIMMLLVGHLPETFSVAASARKPLDELVVVHRPGSDGLRAT